VNLRDVVEPRALTGAVGVVLYGIAGFVSSLFLILMIVLFLLAEGPDLMDRLRASAGTDHPQVKRLAFVGQGVVRQFGLRAILDLVTAVGVTVFLLVLGVDFALMWGILAFFLSFVPYVGLVLAAAPPVLLALAENVLLPMVSRASASPRRSCFCCSCSGPGCSMDPAPFWPCP
jgi:AI-2 transport protein TqsA